MHVSLTYANNQTLFHLQIVENMFKPFLSLFKVRIKSNNILLVMH